MTTDYTPTAAKGLRVILRACLFVLSAGLVTTASAQNGWSELEYGSDVPATLNAALDLTEVDFSSISGSLSFSGDVDMYRIWIGQPEQFSVTTAINSGTHTDTRVFLFREDGSGIAYNDDIPGDSLGHSGLVPDSLGLTETGVYYLAITMYEMIALDADSAEIFEDPRDYGPKWNRTNHAVTDNPLAYWHLRGDGGLPEGTYRMTLTGNAVYVGTESFFANGADLSDAYPNPFRSSTQIDFSTDQPQHVEAAVFDLLGRRVMTVFDGLASGRTTLRIGASEHALAPGTYFVRVRSESGTATRLITALD